ncbi:hypothetical protein DAPPUDRAFT_247854 [Daphnia pulex]|uniref:Uncharacterized protein n=1 Tax=Daphnia pulex TaxID=6669 RepID=E9GT02_DAPPU|nr:hypothetical protein DAPPUDRAFT_247854 [Daphnia pulex]|eukprot:EFX77282.1 hypothetical protein DAPPUDRAFT_247854 [Daphnia pulex]
MLKVLGFGRSPSYNFCCDVVHNWALYRKLGGVSLAGPGWDDNLGPTDITLNKMYRQRLMDPKLPQEFKCRMDVLTAYRSRMLSAVNLNLEGQPSASQSVGEPASGELKELKEEL